MRFWCSDQVSKKLCKIEKTVKIRIFILSSNYLLLDSSLSLLKFLEKILLLIFCSFFSTKPHFWRKKPLNIFRLIFFTFFEATKIWKIFCFIDRNVYDIADFVFATIKVFSQMKVEIILTSFDSTLKSKSEKETSRQLLMEYIVVKKCWESHKFLANRSNKSEPTPISSAKRKLKKKKREMTSSSKVSLSDRKREK